VRQKNSRALFATSSLDPFHRGGIRKDLQCFEKALPLLGRHQNAGGNAVAGNLNRLAALFDVAKELEERVLGLRGGDRAH